MNSVWETTLNNGIIDESEKADDKKDLFSLSNDDSGHLKSPCSYLCGEFSPYGGYHQKERAATASLMKRKTLRKLILSLGVFALIAAGDGGSTASSQLPNPVLVFFGSEFFEAGGKQFTRYKYGVENRATYPNELFAPSPELPPCGANTNASRTWVDLYAMNGRRLYGFCALGKSDNLNGIWFTLERDAIPPSWIYIELVDRKTNAKYRSNLAETTL